MIRSDTRLIAINNPNNPTGALMDQAYLKQIVEIAQQADAYILSDEVYRGTDQQGEGSTASIVDTEGNFLYSFGIQGQGEGEFWMPAGIFIDEQDFIYVADTYNARVQIFQVEEK